MYSNLNRLETMCQHFVLPALYEAELNKHPHSVLQSCGKTPSTLSVYRKSGDRFTHHELFTANRFGGAVVCRFSSTQLGTNTTTALLEISPDKSPDTTLAITTQFNSSAAKPNSRVEIFHGFYEMLMLRADYGIIDSTLEALTIPVESTKSFTRRQKRKSILEIDLPPDQLRYPGYRNQDLYLSIIRKDPGPHQVISWAMYLYAATSPASLHQFRTTRHNAKNIGSIEFPLTEDSATTKIPLDYYRKPNRTAIVGLKMPGEITLSVSPTNQLLGGIEFCDATIPTSLPNVEIIKSISDPNPDALAKIISLLNIKYSRPGICGTEIDTAKCI